MDVSSLPSKVTRKEFEVRARIIHGFLYDYGKVMIGRSLREKVSITCPKHGDFEQGAASHLSGKGCATCWKDRRKGQRHQRGVTNFIRRATQKYADRFDYSKVEYTNQDTPVCIICPEHGEFWQKPVDHLAPIKWACHICAGITKKTTQSLVAELQEIYGSKFDYSKVEYVNDSTKIEVVCPKHGIWFITPSNHLRGKACPRCLGSRISKPEQEWLEFLGVPRDEGSRQVNLHLNGARYQVDGYDSAQATVYEFLGDYWHGNPAKYPPEGIHPIVKVSYGELYKSTHRKIAALESAGYTVNKIWETDWKKLKKELGNGN